MARLADLVCVPSSHLDERRKIVDITDTVKFFQIANREGLRLGNHYHKCTNELFYVIEGELVFKLEDVETKNKQEYLVEPGSSIKIPLYVAHLVIAEPRSKFVASVQPVFDPNDLNKYTIKW